MSKNNNKNYHSNKNNKNKNVMCRNTHIISKQYFI